MIYFQLFLSFFQIGLLSFGGGYAAMPLIQGQVVQGHGWLSMSEFTDLITISQMTPGPIAVNSATFVGIKIAGIPGALVATFGCILPSCILVTLLAKLYLKYREMAMLQGILHSLRPAVVAMIGSAGISILVTAFWSSEGDTVITGIGVYQRRELAREFPVKFSRVYDHTADGGSMSADKLCCGMNNNICSML